MRPSDEAVNWRAGITVLAAVLLGLTTASYLAEWRTDLNRRNALYMRRTSDSQVPPLNLDEISATLLSTEARLQALEAQPQAQRMAEAQPQAERGVHEEQGKSTAEADLQQARIRPEPAHQEGDVDIIPSELGPVNASIHAAFEYTYEGKLWSSEGNGSGEGSTLGATEGTREVLLQVIKEHKIHSMIDVPCGAMAWMPALLGEVEASNPGFKYLGLDIARSVIKSNAKAFRARSNWEFRVFDLSGAEALPRGYDLVLTRDALQHLPCELIVASLCTIASSRARLALIGSYDGGDNHNIEPGWYFPIDLKAPPFLLAPMAEHDERHGGKKLLQFSVKDLAGLDYEEMRQGCAALPPA